MAIMMTTVILGHVDVQMRAKKHSDCFKVGQCDERIINININMAFQNSGLCFKFSHEFITTNMIERRIIFYSVC